jgi:omega-6 fatty acid desaturase (delta-12 desaturase)
LFYGAWIAIAGWGAVVATFFPVFLLMATLGIWLFYIQHTFEEAYWRHHQHWDFTDAALKGSSFYKLPRLLQWFSGNVGYHHVHHLSPKIPNYLLERCHQENEIFKAVPTITIRESVEILRYNPALWDSVQQRLISIEEAEFWYSTKVNTISKQFG